MPKVRAYTPAWLSAAFPDGQTLFAAPTSAYASTTASPGRKKKQTPAPAGPRRVIARRGTEVFVANGKEIRWADLVSMKSAWEATHDSQSSVMSITHGGPHPRPVYRILKPPVADEIRQLVVSPHNNYMAILTAYTVHICVLPDSSHLVAADHDADVLLKTRYFTLGPTTHVTTRAPVVAALWHPLGVQGSALVTVTRDAIVRLWEISAVDRWSFDSAALSIDIKKLADGTWLDQDFGASTNTNAGYSPDLFDMEVAAASFGPRSSGGWSSMTLWIAMLGGDIYALCPLLPKRWAPPPTLVPSLSVAVVANVATVEDDPDVSPAAKRLAQQQLDWMSQLDSQEPTVLESPSPAMSFYAPATEVYTRPSHPGIVPRLQGPFEVDFEGEDDDDNDDDEEAGKLCDIFIIGEKMDMAFLLGVEEDGDEAAALQDLLDVDHEGLSLSVIALVTASGRLHICLDLVGVEAQWLPPRSSPNPYHHRVGSLGSSLAGGKPEPDVDAHDGTTARPLLTFQIVDLVRPSEQRPDAWCTFSPDVTSRYSLFVTHAGGITHVSLANWVFRLEQELQEGPETGADFRVRQLVTGENTTRHRVYVHEREDETLATAVVMRDPDLGYVLLSATDRSPVAVCFEAPDSSSNGAGGSGSGSGGAVPEDAFLVPSMRPSPDPAASAENIAAAAAAATAEEAEDKAALAQDVWKARPAFEVPRELCTASQLAQAQNMLFSSRYQMLQHQEVRLSAATLNIFTNAHKLVGKESGLLNQAAAHMFTKLQDLPIDLHDQVEAAARLKHRIDMIAGNEDEDEDDEDEEDKENGVPGGGDDVRLRRRLLTAQKRHAELSERLERLRRTMNLASARPLSDKERAWAKEVRALDGSLGEGASATTNNDVGRRVQQIHGLWEDMSKQASAVLQKTRVEGRTGGSGSGSEAGSRPGTPTSVSGAPAATPGTPSSHVKVPADVRKAKMAQVTQLLERETAMVDAMTERLERLGVA